MARNLPRVFPKVKHVPPVVRTRSTASHSSVRTLSTASLTFPGPKSGTLWKASLPSRLTFPRRPPPQHPDHQRHHHRRHDHDRLRNLVVLHLYRRHHRHAWPQHMPRLNWFIEQDFDRDALHHLHVIADGVLRRQQAEQLG